MKKYLLTLALAATMFGCEKAPVVPDLSIDYNLTIDPMSLSLVVGQSADLTYDFAPVPTDGALRVDISSQDEKIATVTDKGHIEAVGVGSTRIAVTAHLDYGDFGANQYRKHCEVEVVPVRLIVSEHSLTLEPGSTTQLSAYVNNDPTADIQWRTTDPDIAEVNNGLVRANSHGECLIIAQANSLADTCVVTVTGTPALPAAH